MSRQLPLELKLPLLMSAILAVVLAVALATTYTALRTSALDRAHQRLVRATRQIATVSAAGISTANARYLAVANDVAIRRALGEPGEDHVAAARTALSRLSLPSDSGMPVELWTADGRRVAFAGDDLRALLGVAGRPELPEQLSRTFGTITDRARDSLLVGPLYSEGTRVHFWIVMPVRQEGGRRVIGYIAHQRRISLNPQTQQTLVELSGDSVSLYYRNVDGSHWATGGSVSAAPHVAADIAEGTAVSLDGAPLLFHEERVGSTPLVIGMTIPRRTILARPAASMIPVILSSIVLLAGGVIAAWAIGRRVARPLSNLTRAAEALAAGDYSARVHAEGDPEVRRLADSFNHMAGEIGTSRRALEEQTLEARAANNAKSEFLTTMSHELRTPLNAIGGYVELLEMELRGPLTPAQRRDLERIRASQEHLLGLISGVLDLARVEAGKVTYDLDDLPVDPFLSGLDVLIEPQAAAKSVTLEYVPCPPDLTVVADREKLRQILLNLLSNAIRHTPSGGTVTLSAEQLGGRVQIVVQDTGPGIPEERHDEIFEPFVQLDRSLSRTREGLGLGLAISRDLARGMSGDLSVDRSGGPGARFVLTLNRGTDGANRAMVLTGEAPTTG